MTDGICSRRWWRICKISLRCDTLSDAVSRGLCLKFGGLLEELEVQEDAPALLRIRDTKGLPKLSGLPVTKNLMRVVVTL